MAASRNCLKLFQMSPEKINIELKEKQSYTAVLLKRYLKIFSKIHKKRATLLNKRLRHRCFPMNFTKFLRATFFTEHLRWLLFSKEIT